MPLSASLHAELRAYLMRPGPDHLARLATRLLRTTPPEDWLPLRDTLAGAALALKLSLTLERTTRRRQARVITGALHLLFIELATRRGLRARNPGASVAWGEALPENAVRGWCDAAVRPHAAALGVLLRLPDAVVRLARPLPVTSTPGAAELAAAAALLEIAQALGVTHLRLMSDAQCVFAQARAFANGAPSALPGLAGFHSVCVQWVPREFNRAADGLAHSLARRAPPAPEAA